MNKSNNSSGPETGGQSGRGGDVSFIRAVQDTTGAIVTPSSSGSSTNPGLMQQNHSSTRGSTRSISGQTSNQHHHSSSHQKLLPHDIAALQPHLYAPKHHLKDREQHHHHQQQQTQQQQHLHSSPGSHHHHHQQGPYLPDHMMDTPQQYHLKLPSYGAGASGESAAGRSSHTDGWGEREEALSAELEEAKIRVAQMEKTMRWWSDCTSNWREKWNKASKERNKAKDENRILRAEVTRLRRERKEALVNQGKELSSTTSPDNQTESKQQSSTDVPTSSQQQLLTVDQSGVESKLKEKLSDLSEKEKTVLAGTSEKEASESVEECSEATQSSGQQLSSPGSKHDGGSEELDKLAGEKVLLEEKVEVLQVELTQIKKKVAHDSENAVMMQRKLDEANNTIQAERLEKCSHMKQVEQLQDEVQSLQSKLTEEISLKQELNMQFEKVKVDHQDELNRMSLDLEDEACSRSTMDRRVSELRRDLEHIQAENASEWAKRERLESEKLALERENKKLKSQVSDLEEQLEKRCQASSSVADSDLKTLQFELAENQKELSDVRHSQTKLRKALGERGTELEHTRRRAEQYQEEVKKLRSRVDELKTDLASAEDEVDKQSNLARKAVRNNDELQAQAESLQVQVNHLQTRLRSSTKLGPPISTSRSTSLKSLTLDDTADLGDDSEVDLDDV